MPDRAGRPAAVLGIALVVLSLVVLIVGWGFGVRAVTEVVPGLSSMKVNTALGILGLGVCTWVDAGPTSSRRVAVVALVGAAVALLGGLTVVEYLAAVDLGIDEVLVADPDRSGFPGRMGLNTTIALLALGTAWTVLGRRPASVLAHVAAQVVGSAGGALALFALVGYVLGATSTRGLGSATEMALHTSACLVVATIGLGVATAEQGPLRVLRTDGLTGRLVRSLLLPLAVALLLIGVAVERLEAADLIGDVDLAVAVVVAASLIVLLALVTLLGVRMDRLERQEAAARAERETAQARLAEVLEESQQRLLATNADLERRVEARTRELATANADLVRSNADLAQFAYVASHDLKEPLRMVSAYCHRLADRYADALDDRGRTYVDLAVDGADRMQEMVDALLRFSRVGRESLAPQEVALGTLVDDVLAGMSATLADATVRVGADLPRVVVDTTMFGSVLQNLIGNGAKFRHPDRDPVVEVDAATQVDGTVVLTVDDNGIGIPEDKRASVFRMFARLHKRGTFEGTGIGLAVSQRIVERHGGIIAVQESPLGGTRMVVTIPRSTTPTPEELT